MPMLTLRYDMRSPDFGAPAPLLYQAALEQSAWAEERLRVDAVSVSEHHHCEDGYCPSPLVLAAGIAGATTRAAITVAATVVPLHDPVRLAEDIAVAGLISGGRLVIVLAAGYRPVEFDMLGRDFDSRGRVASAPLPRVEREAGVDVGIARLASVATSDGAGLGIPNPERRARRLWTLRRREPGESPPRRRREEPGRDAPQGRCPARQDPRAGTITTSRHWAWSARMTRSTWRTSRIVASSEAADWRG